MTDKPAASRVLTAEDLKRIAGKGHRCGWSRMPNHYVPSEGCQCKCGTSYDEQWNLIIRYLGRFGPECICKPAAPQPDRLAAFKALAEKWRKMRAHTYASENADHYRGFDAGLEFAADALMAAIAEAEKGAGR